MIICSLVVVLEFSLIKSWLGSGTKATCIAVTVGMAALVRPMQELAAGALNWTQIVPLSHCYHTTISALYLKSARVCRAVGSPDGWSHDGWSRGQ